MNNIGSDNRFNIPRAAIFIMLSTTAILALKNGAGNDIFPYSAYIMLIIQIISFIIVVPHFRIPFYGKPMLIMVLWFLLFMSGIVSGFWSDYQWLTLQRSLLVFVPGLMLLVIVYSDKKPANTFWLVSKGLVIYGTFLAFVGIILYFFGTIVGTPDGTIQQLSLGPIVISQSLVGVPPLLRISSLTGNANGLASILMLSIILTFSLYYAQKISRKKMLCLSIVQGMGILLTYSRAGIGTTLVMGGLLYFLTAKIRIGKLLKFLIIGITAILLVQIMFQISENLPSIENRLNAGLNDREEAWGLAVDSIVEKPITGVGFGISFEEIFVSNNFKFTAHNLYIAILSEVGIFAFLLFIALWLFGIYSSWNGVISEENRGEDFLVAASVLVFLIGFFIHQFFELQLMRYGFHTIYWLYLIGVITHPTVTKSISDETGQHVS